MIIPENKRKKYTFEFDEYEVDWIKEALECLFEPGGCFRKEYDGDQYVDSHRMICEQLLDKIRAVKSEITI
jgi:hypothetical protein